MRNGRNYYHARRIVEAMGLKAWGSHLTERTPSCSDELGWTFGVDYTQEPGLRRGLPPFWLSPAAARQVCDQYA